MEPVRSSLGAGVAAAVVLLVALLASDAILGGTFRTFTAFTSLCTVTGPPYCRPGTVQALVLTYVTFFALFAVAWPLLFGGFTWGLPGESGLLHGVVFGLFLWAGYVLTLLFTIGIRGNPGGEPLPLLAVTFGVYLLYGLVLGGVYDHLAEHRTFLSVETDSA
jgi:hypothetical protein